MAVNKKLREKSLLDHRIRAHIETLRRRKNRVANILQDWKGGDSTFVLKEYEALEWVLFLVEDLYEEEPETFDSYGIEWFKKDDE